MQPLNSRINSDAGANGDTEPSASEEALAFLRRFARVRPPVERCELCGAELGPEHQHLLDTKSRQVACSCDACAILFCGQQGAKFLRIPRRIVRLEGFSLTDLQWEAMMLPINLAFFLRQPGGETAAMYPSPAGAMESLIELPNWNELFGENQAVGRVEPEVEALMVNRVGNEAMYFVVPIDACYRLIGLIRTKWRGLSGGGEVWQAIADFFSDLDRRATKIEAATHA
jgi:hypothetical protein